MKGYERKWLLQVCNVITEQLLQRNIVYTVKKKAKIKKKKKKIRGKFRLIKVKNWNGPGNPLISYARLVSS